MSEPLKNLGDSLHPLLKSAGFRRRRSSWTRRTGQFVDVVNLQLSKSFDRVWVNLGVADPDAYESCWGEPLRDVADEAMCTVRARLGMLVDNRDKSWDLTDPHSISQIAGTVQRYGLPFLDQMHGLAAMEAHLAKRPRAYPPEAMSLAIIRWKLGMAREACEALTDRGRRDFGPWQERVDAVARKIDCSS